MKWLDWLLRRRPKRTVLVVMRLIDMHMVHPAQDNSHACARCGQQVGVYPSGQAVLAKEPDTEIVCNICHALETGYYSRPAPGALDEIGQGVPRNKP